MVFVKLSLRRCLYVCVFLLLASSLHLIIVSDGIQKIKKHFSQPSYTDVNYNTFPIQPKLPKPSTRKDERSSENKKVKLKEKAWFFVNGTRRPSKRDEHSKAFLMPQDLWGEDRIVEQLMYVPANYDEKSSTLKTILYYHGMDTWLKEGRHTFIDAGCPVSTCYITSDKALAATADAIIFKDNRLVIPPHKRDPKQVWILTMLESPPHTGKVSHNDVGNWTATYRRDSEIVTPYEKWVYYDKKVKQRRKPLRNYAKNKTHQVAWFVSNCGARNGRMEYARELQKYISVDIYGACGPYKCSRTSKCSSNLLDEKYKFYLAFENSNCIDYITEKFFVNGLQHDILPIVLGARRIDYEAAAPMNSFIHVDDFDTAKDLAEYLLKLDKDDDAYNSYFLWKGTGEFIDTKFSCRLCAMLHADVPHTRYKNINRWWAGPNTCISSGPWPNQDQ